MNRYFFHIRDGQTSLDETGSECGSIEDVRIQALQMTGETLRHLGPKFWEHSSWTMWVTDGSGETVLTLQLMAKQPPLTERFP